MSKEAMFISYVKYTWKYSRVTVVLPLVSILISILGLTIPIPRGAGILSNQTLLLTASIIFSLVGLIAYFVEYYTFHKPIMEKNEHEDMLQVKYSHIYDRFIKS